nr:unnamed protein product [Callosobruchus chinensis]
MLQKTFSALIQPSLFVPLVAVHNLLNVVGRLGKVRQSATTSAAAAAVGAFRPCIREQQRSPRPSHRCQICTTNLPIAPDTNTVARMMTVQLNVDMEWERYNVRSIHH